MSKVTKAELEKQLEKLKKQLAQQEKQLEKQVAQQEKAPKGKAKAKPTPKPTPASSDSEDENLLKPKLEAPKAIFDGEAKEFKGWLRTVELWHNIRKKHASGKVLGALVMESVQGDARTTVYSHLVEGKEKYKAIIDVLKDEYDLDPVLKVTDAMAALRDCHRKPGETLTAHLKNYAAKRTEAMKHGYIETNVEGTDLLASCNLQPQTHAQRANLTCTILRCTLRKMRRFS